MLEVKYYIGRYLCIFLKCNKIIEAYGVRRCLKNQTYHFHRFYVKGVRILLTYRTVCQQTPSSVAQIVT